MRDGITRDFRADKRLDQIDEVLVAQKFEGIASPGKTDIGTAVDLVTLVSQTGQTLCKGLFRIKVGDLAPIVQIPGNLIDDEVVVLDDRLEIVVAESIFNDHIALFFKETEMITGNFHFSSLCS